MNTLNRRAAWRAWPLTKLNVPVKIIGGVGRPPRPLSMLRHCLSFRSWRDRLLIDCIGLNESDARYMFNGRVPDLNIVVSCLTFRTPSHSFSIACRLIHHEFLFQSVKLPRYLEMFQSRENASLPSFPFSRRQNLTSMLWPRPRF